MGKDKKDKKKSKSGDGAFGKKSKKDKAVAGKKAPLPVSPLAPKGGFPALPAIKGVRFAAGAAGVRYQGRTDVMMAEICAGAAVAGVFTRSATRSAPVLDCQAKLAALKDRARGGFGLIVNSGNSNAFTGQAGVETVRAVTQATADVLGVPVDHVFSASTGVIGEPFGAERITHILPQLAANLGADAAEGAARAIMTTDTFPKGALAEIEIDGKPVRLIGFAKGSGMIAPDMATMLAYIFTDAAVAQPVLQRLLKKTTETTFNAISVDSDTSTSDSLMAFATGKAGHARIETTTGKAARQFAAALHAVMEDLALQLVRDGEGATKFVEINVTGAASIRDARKVARAIADSPLVKTALAGEDPNWGRIVMAVGKSGARADRDLLSIRFGDIVVAEQGRVSPNYTEAAGAAYMKGAELQIGVDLGLGRAKTRFWTCDLTHGYIDINADYRS